MRAPSVTCARSAQARIAAYCASAPSSWSSSRSMDSSAAVARAGVEGAEHGRGRRPLERELVERADVELVLLERPERDRCAP
ncbi:hypothetical protein [Sorangium sp. So ce119]|uniref:hypothetical protein n=1 Tax=unclassified Sorangium TaxID=2621164 RepID=UPI003F608AF0